MGAAVRPAAGRHNAGGGSPRAHAVAHLHAGRRLSKRQPRATSSPPTRPPIHREGPGEGRLSDALLSSQRSLQRGREHHARPAWRGQGGGGATGRRAFPVMRPTSRRCRLSSPNTSGRIRCSSRCASATGRRYWRARSRPARCRSPTVFGITPGAWPLSPRETSPARKPSGPALAKIRETLPEGSMYGLNAGSRRARRRHRCSRRPHRSGQG